MDDVATGHLVFSRASGCIASFLFLLTPVFLRWSIESHPDLPQLFFLLCGLYYALHLCGGYDTRSLVLSCVFSGLAFGTKYSGVFLLPLIVLCLLLPEDGVLRPSAAVRRLKTVRIWLLLLGVPAIFCVTVAITNPYMVLAFDAFRESLMMEKGIMGFGYSFRVETSGAEWLYMLWGLMGSVYGAVLLVTLTVCVLSVKREGRVPAAPGMLLLWMAVFVTYLMLEVNLRRPRHLLPVLPCGLVVVGYGYTVIWSWVRKRLDVKWLWSIPVLLLLSLDHVSGSMRLFGEGRTRIEDNVELAAGRWLASNYPPETTVLYDAYSYVPASFRNVFRSFGISYPMVSHFEPDLLIIRNAIGRDFLDKEKAAGARRGAAHYLERHYFYKFINEGLIQDYHLAKRYDIFSYCRKGPEWSGREADMDETFEALLRRQDT